MARVYAFLYVVAFSLARTSLALATELNAKEHYIDLENGIIMHAVSYGSDAPDAETLVLLHGFPEGWYIWHSLAKELVTTAEMPLRVVMPDLRGYNLTSKPDLTVENYRIEAISGDVVRLLERLEAPKLPHLVIHDWGGPAGFAAASQAPHLVASILTLNGPHLQVLMNLIDTDAEQQRKSNYMLSFRNPSTASYFEANDAQEPLSWFEEYPFFDKDTRDAFQRGYLEGIEEGKSTLRAGLYWYTANVVPVKEGTFEAGLEPWPHADLVVSVPTIALWGMQDTAFNNEANVLQLCDYLTAPLSWKRYDDLDHFEVTVSADVARDVLGWISGVGVPDAQPHVCTPPINPAVPTPQTFAPTTATAAPTASTPAAPMPSPTEADSSSAFSFRTIAGRMVSMLAMLLGIHAMMAYY